MNKTNPGKILRRCRTAKNKKRSSR